MCDFHRVLCFKKIKEKIKEGSVHKEWYWPILLIGMMPQAYNLKSSNNKNAYKILMIVKKLQFYATLTYVPMYTDCNYKTKVAYILILLLLFIWKTNYNNIYIRRLREVRIMLLLSICLLHPLRGVFSFSFLFCFNNFTTQQLAISIDTGIRQQELLERICRTWAGEERVIDLASWVKEILGLGDVGKEICQEERGKGDGCFQLWAIRICTLSLIDL